MTNLYKILVGTKMGIEQHLYYEIVYYSAEYDYILTNQTKEPDWRNQGMSNTFSLEEAEKLIDTKMLNEKYDFVKLIDLDEIDDDVKQKKDEQLTDTEYQLMWVLANEAVSAIEFKGGYKNFWFTEKEAKVLLAKLAKIDDEIREG
ncbi:hypothetical protein [Carnobacterium maltaromaticum]|uniref:hypothetical protein n=1 Tax=Carnobacterium maltaromaticum TaxID=2751 RepID=UPI00165C50F8|nr:hypothetical protein [Carnobacterium maltaromaticum]MBC9788603.1 hypothetical protein [Carnobacterium maltaromaticum]